MKAVAVATPLPSVKTVVVSVPLRNVPLATVDIVIVWATILWCVFAVWPHYKLVGAAQVPYLV